jgi:uncharacterized protein YhhL (DUF1145 family)
MESIVYLLLLINYVRNLQQKGNVDRVMMDFVHGIKINVFYGIFVHKQIKLDVQKVILVVSGHSH